MSSFHRAGSTTRAGVPIDATWNKVTACACVTVIHMIEFAAPLLAFVLSP
jgi:hypothetical protein